MERFKRQPIPSAFGSGLSSHSRLRAASVASGSGEHSLRFGLMREVLLRYLSPILLDSVLTRALEVRKLSPATLTEPELAEVAADIMVGLRLFVPEERLPQLMLDLAELLGARMNAPVQTLPPAVEARLAALENEVRALAQSSLQQVARMDATAELVRGGGQQEKLSLIVFSGSLDRLIAAFVLATGAAAMGMQVSMFFTFWGTAALRRESVHVKKTLLERMFGWMLPKGVKKLPLSQMNMAGGGPMMIRYIMKKNGVASVEEMIELSKELGVELNVCTMSMDLLGMKAEELIDYPGRTFCGVAKFLETAAPGKITMFL